MRYGILGFANAALWNQKALESKRFGHGKELHILGGYCIFN